MLRILLAFFVLGLGAVAWVLLLPEPGKQKPKLAAVTPAVAETPTAAQPASDNTAQVAAVVTPPVNGREIRVVYPGPDGAASVRKLVDKVEPQADPVPAPAVAVVAPPSTTVAPLASPAAPTEPAVQTASAVPADAVPGSPLPPAGAASALNINTASVEALNQIPGAGHIGRTIASHRPYTSIEELVSKRVLRKSVYDKIKDQIATN